ncbi:hypothetical protein LZ578_00495 [Jeotgalibaca sp. MA1X17-3]|uniref:hypothetical protein n=1 Tax=Jeotgalibaca sp. MA1X17-3 TaxID=2908211 RepID=UPI001F2A48FB|nr:hypothetical protein [Jeotgalibaca sp. MA1X17-3]UJF15725.1 hypothetical protein LZ578_00495 [Jeotgalibaca sp. MA1X17-3]
MINKKSITLLSTMLLMAGCSGGLNTNGSEESTVDKGTTESTPVVNKDIEYASNLNISYAVGNNQRTLTYNQSTPLTMADGNVISTGDLKPTWQYIQDKMGFTLKDVTVQNQTAEEMIEIASATGFKNAAIYGGANGDAYMEYGSKGYFVDLNEKMDQLPNFSEYLKERPAIADAITAFDGGIYYIPYVAEIDNYARVFNGRETWVMTILDNKELLENETATLPTAYEGYWDRNKTNVVALQNEKAASGELSRDDALDTLLSYIKETYPELEKPSDLFLGTEAQYDVDELVALWRVMKLSPNTLSKASTGEVVDGSIIYPFFVRDSKNRQDYLRLITYFGGQRIFGADTQQSNFVLNEDGELVFSFTEEGNIEGLEYLNELYSEGLIHSEFADLNNKDAFRNMFYGQDDYEAQKQFGFMTIDWISSTTALNEDVTALLPPLTTLGSDDEMIHFMENTRTIKPEGWAVSSKVSDEEINAALKVMDYFFSEEGNQVQNYGTPDMLVEGEMYTGPNGVEYPKYDEWTFDIVDELKDGDISAFLRDFVGSQMPLGYQKEIGFEYQYTVNQGYKSWETYQEAEVITPSYGAEKPLLKLTPTVFSLNEQEQAKLDTTSIGETEADQMYLFITGSPNGPQNTDEIKALYDKGGIDTYTSIYQAAYERMTK